MYDGFGAQPKRSTARSRNLTRLTCASMARQFAQNRYNKATTQRTQGGTWLHESLTSLEARLPMGLCRMQRHANGPLQRQPCASNHTHARAREWLLTMGMTLWGLTRRDTSSRSSSFVVQSTVQSMSSALKLARRFSSSSYSSCCKLWHWRNSGKGPRRGCGKGFETPPSSCGGCRLSSRTALRRRLAPRCRSL